MLNRVLLLACIAGALAFHTCFAAQIAPLITWDTPPDIIKGERLGPEQLNAAANVPGTFNYSPGTGTVLEVGQQVITADFMPDDTQTYLTARAQVAINVLPVPNNVAAANYAVELSAAVSANPPQITLNWTADSNATAYAVYRKTAASADWGSGVALPANATTYVDTSISDGAAYEYRVAKTALEASSGFPYSGYGFIYAGIDQPLTEYRGKVILLVDNTFSITLAAELARLQDDLTGDGWTVLRHDVSRSAAVADVKTVIVNEYNADPANVKCVFLFGHIPVPYSGNLNPDGHPEHRGAWPADVYYANIAGVWTDSSVNKVTAARQENWNVPGDGKFDQSKIPSPLELELGRVDLSNMPAFTKSETELLAQYLDKDHAFRHKQVTLPQRGLINDTFTALRDQASANAWRLYPPLFNAGEIATTPFVTTLSSHGFLWSYGAGAGDYTSAAGVVATQDFVLTDTKTVFTMLFGSFFGDWDNANNLLRAPLCTSSYTLTSAWVGRPSWYFHHMALGETIGYSALISQNNDGAVYPLDNDPYRHDGRGVHMALMGDPTLRMHVLAPPSQLSATSDLNGVTLSWLPSPDAAAGYYIYRATSRAGPFVRVNSDPVNALTYVDPVSAIGSYTYMVRALALQNTSSGTYWNASQGVFLEVASVAGAISASATPNPAGVGQPVSFSAAAAEAGGATFTYAWDFGDGASATGASVTHVYTSTGVYSVVVAVTDDKGQSASRTITMTVNTIVGPEPDLDGDGFSDELELAAGGPPADPNSALYGLSTSTIPIALTLNRLAIHLNFSKTSRDGIALSGRLPTLPQFDSRNKAVILVLGGVVRVFRLDAKGRSIQPDGACVLQTKPKGGVSAFTLKLSKGAFAAKLNALGLDDATVIKPLTVPVIVIFDGKIFRTDRAQTYVAHKGKTALTKDMR